MSSPLCLALIVVLFALVGSCSKHSPIVINELPADFIDNRIFVRPVLPSGDTLRFITDTGGISLLTPQTAQRLGLRVEEAAVTISLKDTTFSRTIPLAALPTFSPKGAIPDLPINEDAFSRSLGGRLQVLAYERHGELNTQVIGDGLLGQLWFSGRCWTFDYLNGQLLLHEATVKPAASTVHTVPLGFWTNVAGERLWNWPSIEVTIEGEVLPFLFDTGATVVASDETLAIVDPEGSAVQGTSFATASLFERWREQHPDWRVIEPAERDGSGAMIEIPAVTVAGHTVGPVWFTRRPDRGFQAMSIRMDREVTGALGGSLLQHFRVTIDYLAAEATFERGSRPSH